MSKKYNLVLGVIVSLFISLLASVPRVLKADEADYKSLAINAFYTFSLTIFCWLFHQFTIHSRIKWRWADTPWLKYTLSICIGISFSIFYHDFFVSIFAKASPMLLENVAQERRLITLGFRGLIISGFLFLVVYYLNLSEITQKSKIENEKLKKENMQARLESLKQQISPHFLFNTLNTLSTLTKETKVKEYISEISNVYRYLLQYKENDMVTVGEELQFIESYLYILRERFEVGLQVSITISEGTRQTLLPPLALQVLVENAVKHNIVSASRPLSIEIKNENNFIIVKNNLQQKQSLGNESSRSGLNNIQERYTLLANKEIVIEKTVTDFIVKLPVLV
ncbi:MAG: histidine kinase [Cyclobacteriaceae bacterium]|nr:histidine kinase [Cyclobacteriaceae bacterium]